MPVPNKSDMSPKSLKADQMDSERLWRKGFWNRWVWLEWKDKEVTVRVQDDVNQEESKQEEVDGMSYAHWLKIKDIRPTCT